MVKNVRVAGFKSMKELEVEIKNFNLFSGTNSSGKSSLLQSILLLSQNLDNVYGLNGPLVSVGDYRDVKNYNVSMDSIKIEVRDENETIGILFEEDKTCRLLGDAESGLAEKMRYGNNRLHYLSCNRVGAQDIYKKNRTVNAGVGINGEYAIDYLCMNRDLPLEDSMVKEKSNYTLSAQVNYWLKYIIGANIKAEEIIGTDVVKASYGMMEGKYSRPNNVGSGISYLISIIVMCLGSGKNDILIIENPEIHLHPLSQSRLCEFLYFISNADRQLMIETHSDHIFNALRVGIAAETMAADNITINFLRLGSDNCTRNHVIEIGKYGRIENPVPNMFDQFQIDLDKMIGV